MKIGILTFHCANNYGAVLQAYALQEYLRKDRHDAYIINYCPQYITSYYRAFGNRTCDMFKYILKSCILAHGRLKKQYLFQKFRHQYLHLYDLDLNNVYNDFDAFVFGSDQIWNPAITKNDKNYFAAFKAADGKKLIAYSTSMGSVKNVDSTLKMLCRNELKKFSAISVREDPLRKYIEANFQYKVSLTCDPVFLASRNIFDVIAAKPRTNKPYLLLMSTFYNQKLFDYAKQLSSEYSLKFINLATYEKASSFKRKKIVSLTQFLGYIKHATYILTDSFHGTALSVLFKKNFNTIERNSQMDERARSLLKSLGIENRMLALESNINVSFSEVDYSDVDRKLDKLVITSQQYLREALQSNSLEI